MQSRQKSAMPLALRNGCFLNICAEHVLLDKELAFAKDIWVQVIQVS
jgi:hypothetical protein